MLPIGPGAEVTPCVGRCAWLDEGRLRGGFLVSEGAGGSAAAVSNPVIVVMSRDIRACRFRAEIGETRM